MSDHEKYLNEALKLAAKGLGRVAPNPLVGALLVRNGRIVGRGWHQDYGGLHAEANAIKDAGEKARGATLYCTLEPCNHQGKQPPCSQAVIDAGISQVILGALDPNPIAAGGIGTLTASGVAVVTGVHEERCAAINAPFFKRVASGLPYVTLKWAMTLDGKIATHSGDSKWVTSEPAREFSHRLRACHDAILVGVGTVLADNPSLNVRLPLIETGRFRPRRVILDSRARTPLTGALWEVPNSSAPTILVTAAAEPSRVQALRNKGAAVLVCAEKDGHIDLHAALKTLSELGVNSVLVDGGSAVLGAFADARLFDAVRVFVAPKIAGSGKSLTAVGGGGVEKMQDALKIGTLRSKAIGDDLLLSAETGAHWSLDTLAETF
jgi:diaminohydroxyphosphoribosylaminopyrimidine deaminase / 5-amino-6-(5-phosphoribosylamino)uracil reductase